MSTYQQAGVDIEKGDQASHNASMQARKTFAARKGLIGQPVIIENGFAGALDMGDFYLIQNDDGVGTKIIVAQLLKKYDTIGIDLLATTLDDAACMGAEVVSVTNTIDTDKVDPDDINQMMDGLQREAIKHKVILPGGEIAELKDMAKGYIWNSTAVGIVEKDKLITGKDIQPGDPIIGLKENVVRANGLTLVRHVLKEKFGPDWHLKPYDENNSWGEIILTPSKIFYSAVIELHGRFKQPKIAELKGIAHITGGGIKGNLSRILPKGLGAKLDNLFDPHPVILKLQEYGNVSDQEAYKTWNMGTGMLIVSRDTQIVIDTMKKHNIEAQIVGQITDSGQIEITSRGYFRGKI